MKILSSNIKASYVIKKSRFLCFGYIVKSKNEVKDIIAGIKKQYPDASHICYSYILDEKTFYYTDGGEPSGTAGKPIYGAMQSLGLNYTLFVVIRYFGGIKFGTGPLRQTFKNITLETLKTASIKSAQMLDLVSVDAPYSSLKKLEQMFRSSIITKTYNKNNVSLTIVGQADLIIDTLAKLNLKPISIKHNQVV